MRIVVFGLTVSSSWGNGHATAVDVGTLHGYREAIGVLQRIEEQHASAPGAGTAARRAPG